MTHIIERFKAESSAEFYAIRETWLDDSEDNTAFGTWLKNHGLDEEHEGDQGGEDPDSYLVTKIIFKSESAYLAFKLKYM